MEGVLCYVCYYIFMSAPYSLVNNDEIESEWHIIVVIVQYEIEGVFFFLASLLTVAKL
jgi:hypothetical protein